MIAQKIQTITQQLPSHVTLVAVSKTHPSEAITEAYNSGVRDFGENKVQELLDKYAELPKDIKWHFIGHLQTNKVKYIAPFVSLIHGVDSYKLLSTIQKEGEKNKRIIPCLLQFHIAQEETKFGLHIQEAQQLIQHYFQHTHTHVSIVGVMGMATYTENTNQIRQEFANLHAIFTNLKNTYFSETPEFKHISMGMSQDYSIAIEQGSTMVRIGSTIFGERYYSK